MRVLVTGGAGFIGTYTCEALAERGHEPLVFDHNRDSAASPVFLGDIRDATAVTEAVAHVDGVIHLAGVLGTQETITNPRPAAETNVMGGLNVLEACAQYGIPLVNIGVGNWFEYNTYSVSKHCVDRFAEMFARYRNLPVATVRVVNAYGPRQSVAQPYGTSRVRKVIPSFVARALHGNTIEVYGDGSQVMDMVYVPDAAMTLVRALEYMAADHVPPHGGFECGTGRATTVDLIAKTVQAEVLAQAGKLAEITHTEMRKGETPGVTVLADPGNLRVLGVDPDGFVTLEDGIARTVAYYREMFGL